MEMEKQWQAFLQTGDIRDYLRYKGQEPTGIAGTMGTNQQKELVDGSDCHDSACVARSEL